MALLVCALTLGLAASPQTPPDPIWRPATKEELKLVNPKTRAARAKECTIFKCDLEALRAALKASPVWKSPGYRDKMTVVEFPWPDGTLVAFKVNHYPTEVGMLFDGIGVKNPEWILKGNMISTTFKISVNGPKIDGLVVIESVAPSSDRLYGSFFVKSGG
jgi:hypothetical protein